MKKAIVLFLLVAAVIPAVAQSNDTVNIRAIFTQALTHEDIYENLRYLCKTIGGRIGGSAQAARTVIWAADALHKAGADTVYLQEHMVESWKRGEKEICKATPKAGGSKVLSVCALGGSVGTGPGGITAGIIEVRSLAALDSLGYDRVRGNIVFFNRPCNPVFYNTYAAYGGGADQRVHGASQAARYGAVAAVSRSLTLAHHDYPHTGIMRYEDSIPRIPAFAISTKSADLLSKLLKENPETKLFLRSTSHQKPDTLSHNVIAEIRGSEFPDQIILVGAHTDAWDNGEGAHDDGVGVVQSIEVIRIFRALGIIPRHTIRVVQYMDEEMNQRGARKYATVVAEKKEKHIAAIESDRGGFTPFGFSYDAGPEVATALNSWKPLLEEYGLWQWRKGYSGVDIYFLKEQGIPLLALITDSQRYFDYQHAGSDVLEAVNRRELQLGAAAIASLVYLIDKYGF